MYGEKTKNHGIILNSQHTFDPFEICGKETTNSGAFKRNKCLFWKSYNVKYAVNE